MHAYLSLGANIGDREGNIARALKLIAGSPGLRLLRVSSLYATEPVGYHDQPEFLNAAAVVDSAQSAAQLLSRLRAVERLVGRKVRERWHEREIDIDIVLLDDIIIDEEELRIPHPEMQNRGFVLVPLAEIAPGALHPVLGLTVVELLERLDDRASVRNYTVGDVVVKSLLSTDILSTDPLSTDPPSKPTTTTNGQL